MAVIERRDVYGLGEPWHPILRAYALAIGRMKALSASDPRSLAYQASVHGFRSESDPPPDRFRGQCQHNCWYFLPWHRWYLHYYERIIRSLLAEIDEVPDEVAESWALPYWNYARDAGAAKLPPEFASPTLWDGRRNPLFDDTRLPEVNDRSAALDRVQTVPGRGVLDQPFSALTSGVATFGGTASGWHHFREPGAVAGGLEGTPHNDVHGFVGGNMWRFATAGLDPVFWLHHCNIDRYWEMRGHDADPTGWADVSFDFRTETGAAVRVDADGCVDTEGQLGYRYEDITRPDGLLGGAERRSEMAPGSEIPPEVVGTRGRVHLQGRRVDATMEVGAPSGDFLLSRGRERDQRVFLTVNDIVGEANPGISYAVYLGERADESCRAGLISFFGIEGTREGGHPLGYAFDVTDIVHTLEDEGAWNPDDVHVVFEPVGAVLDEGRSKTEDTAPVEVGSVSIAYQ